VTLAIPLATEWASIVALIEGLGGLIAILGLLYRFVECQQPGCHRLGLHPHRHLKLCAAHHPAVDGDEVTAEHIASQR
jgi:hypothetical protein